MVFLIESLISCTSSLVLNMIFKLNTERMIKSNETQDTQNRLCRLSLKFDFYRLQRFFRRFSNTCIISHPELLYDSYKISPLIG